MKKHFSRRDFLKSSLAMAAAGAVMPAALAQQKKPNILFILADDLGWADLGCYGNTYHETPNIDRLAQQGMRFTDAYAACPVCSPTRASLMSGQYPAHVGITDFIPGHWRPYAKLTVPVNRTQHLPDEVVTFAEALKQGGYATGSFGKWHLGDPQMTPGKQGFDEWVITRGWAHFGNVSQPDIGLGEDDYLSEELTELGMKFMEDHQDEPFCLYVSHFAVHLPLEARQDLIHKYANKAQQNEEVNNPVYAAMVEHVDLSVGALLDKLEELGLAENTVVFFYSDNGGLRQMFNGEGPIVTSNAPLRGEKGEVYEGGIREPLIVRSPGVVAAGSTCGAPVTTVDMYPTFLDIADVEKPENYTLDGLSLLPLLKSQQESLKRDAIYWHYPHYHHMEPAGAIRAGDWKLVELFDSDKVELYNLRQDIGETTDLAPFLPEKAEELRQKLAQWRQSVDAAMPKPNPEYDPERAGEWGTHPDRG